MFDNPSDEVTKSSEVCHFVIVFYTLLTQLKFQSGHQIRNNRKKNTTETEILVK